MIPNKFKTLAVAACLSLGAGSAANALVLTVDDIGFGAGAEVVLTDAVTPGLINFPGPWVDFRWSWRPVLARQSSVGQVRQKSILVCRRPAPKQGPCNSHSRIPA
jgi:hypothetical protein